MQRVKQLLHSTDETCRAQLQCQGPLGSQASFSPELPYSNDGYAFSLHFVGILWRTAQNSPDALRDINGLVPACNAVRALVQDLGRYAGIL